MEYKDYYKILGVERTATQDEIKRAYRKLARTYHPDVNKEPDAETKFKDAGEAYEVLKDPEKRAAYNELGANWQQGQQFRPPPNWDAGFEFSGGGYTDADPSQFSDFFEGLFGERMRGTGRGGAGGAGAGAGRGGYQRREFHMPGEDHHAKVVINLRDAYTGAKREITLRVPELDDTGHVTVKDRTLSITIPKGIREGQSIRLAGQGSPGMGKGQPGDLYLEIAFAPDPHFRVEGKDVYLDLPITPWEAALGASIKVPTPEGAVMLKIPPGSTKGRTMRLKGKGIPSNPPGDMHAVLKIETPAADSDKAKELYKEMERELPFNPRASLGV
ncbi:DnaJ C-terminal domain-containing protein [Hyphomicrobium sulfonivorans]|uniref:DnaJ C-terminal domain-containing protein n=1 Tax=Hyphomicrobium sulfonivorans TaxID=121290 RepID=UPI001570DA83|nr:DnaJ C-terminal domain-containing protein [Hyphomicrobium sulfonivorans]MBI1648432.1 DnaJ domain-containing protein [Hyphomicrobium sulfonivorans]NSL71032.1 cytochrome C biogenesis protein [Hyphomicrobium sulfonivorans]